MKSKIFFLNTCVEWGGGEKWTYETALELHRKGYDVVIGSTPESDLYKKALEEGLCVKNVPIRNNLSFLNPLKLISFVRYLRQERINLLLMNLSQDLKFGALAGKLASVNKIIYRRGSAIPIKDRFYTRLLLKDYVTDIIANSQATKDTILVNTSQWLDEAKIKIIYNGIKLDKIEAETQDSTLSDIREEFGIGKDEVLIGNIGRLSKQKGHCYLVEAVKSLVLKGIRGFKVLIVGKGELEESIKAQVRELSLEDYIIFAGFRTDIYNIMHQMDFLLHTALWEGFGFVIAEAMALGKPVVSTDVSNISEIMIDGKTGYLCQSQNPLDIAEKTLQMINSAAFWSEMGDLGQKVILENFNFSDKVEQFEKLYLQ